MRSYSIIILISQDSEHLISRKLVSDNLKEAALQKLMRMQIIACFFRTKGLLLINFNAINFQTGDFIYRLRSGVLSFLSCC